MNFFLMVLTILVIIFVWKNADWFKYMWKEHICGDFPKSYPSFCMDCKEYEDTYGGDVCNQCEAKKAWNHDPDYAYRLFEDMQKRRNMKF